MQTMDTFLCPKSQTPTIICFIDPALRAHFICALSRTENTTNENLTEMANELSKKST